MKKKILLIALLGISGLLSAQNALISDPTTGNITAPTYEIEFVYDGTDLLLVTGSYNTGYLYAIDYNDASPDGVHDWETNTIPDIVESIAGILGASEANLVVRDVEVNPKTKSVVILVFDTEASITYLFEAKNPEDISLITLTGVTYSRVKYTTDSNYLHDMAWSTDENKLYYAQGDFTLDGSVGFVEAPFVHNSEGTIRATSVFKSNWGGSYFTNAPLEKLSISKVNGNNRLMGVTTCAPGFSIPTSHINEADDLISVTEDFNVRNDRPLRVVTVSQESGTGTATYLFDLHEHPDFGTQVIRIGEKYLTGNVLDTNNVSELIRTGPGAIVASLNDNEAKELATGYKMISFYSDYNLMVIDDNDVLRLMNVTSEFLGLSNQEELQTLGIIPNPANDIIHVDYQSEESGNTEYIIYDTQGKIVLSGIFNSQNIDVKQLDKGNYIFTLNKNGAAIGSSQLIKL